MEYIYGAPPPPPLPDNGGNSGENGQSGKNSQNGQKRKLLGKGNGNVNGQKRSKPNGFNKPNQNNNVQSSFLDLPTHLPNVIPKQMKETQDDKETVASEKKNGEEEVESKDVVDAKPEGSGKEPVPVFGTDIVLKTDQDIEDWIKERKLNWMKKISNNREPEPEPEPQQEPTREKAQRDHKNQKQTQNDPRKRNQNNRSNQVHNQRIHHQQQRGPNLNNLIIQRDIQQQNLAILDVISELFEQNVIKHTEQ